MIENMSKNTVPDVIKHDLDILFVGINPGLMSAKIGHHFGHPGNRFWPSLYSAGFTPSLLSPYMESKLLQYGYGITNLVPRATKTAAEISTTELIDGLKLLDRKINIYRQKWRRENKQQKAYSLFIFFFSSSSFI